ncbi:MAG: excalibur calcium-binding domain-containing protein [Novosphingobium sp.]|nr:excalibur calcium-binding domain-containing protein [Novosphingobium sp.]
MHQDAIHTWTRNDSNLSTPPSPLPVIHDCPVTGGNDARAAGTAPIYLGEPGYRPEMDGDGDGIACEPRRGM